MKHFSVKALTLEADYGLGRNPLNMIQMTTASTLLESKRSVINAYTTGGDESSGLAAIIGNKSLHRLTSKISDVFLLELLEGNNRTVTRFVN